MATDLASISNLVFGVLFSLIIWTAILGSGATGKDATRAAQAVYFAGVIFILAAGSVALLITAIKLAA